ncbi:MAG: hypothetical protein IT292_08210 [Deltaproteobacteria bacterium]|nr:hypothetical protein [Deltaproteobacteria bacterium]
MNKFLTNQQGAIFLELALIIVILLCPIFITAEFTRLLRAAQIASGISYTAAAMALRACGLETTPESQYPQRPNYTVRCLQAQMETLQSQFDAIKESAGLAAAPAITLTANGCNITSGACAAGATGITARVTVNMNFTLPMFGVYKLGTQVYTDDTTI